MEIPLSLSEIKMLRRISKAESFELDPQNFGRLVRMKLVEPIDTGIHQGYSGFVRVTKDGNAYLKNWKRGILKDLFIGIPAWAALLISLYDLFRLILMT